MDKDFELLNNAQHPKKFKSWWEALVYFRWLSNFWLLGLPFCFFVILWELYNIAFNIYFNNFWAEANVFLIANTVFSLSQGFQSFFIILEIPVYLRHFKFFRFWSLMFAIIYNGIFSFFTLRWLWRLFVEEEADIAQMKNGTLFEMLFIAYNLICHFGIYVINDFIIVKEISMEFFQLLNNNAGSRRFDDVSLGFGSLWLVVVDIIWGLNPITWWEEIQNFTNWS